MSLAHYETLRRQRTNAPTPEATSVRVAAKVTGNNIGGPPLLGSAVAVAVGLAVAVAVELAVAVGLAMAVAVAVAVAVGLALIQEYRCAEAPGANSKTTTALKVNRSKNLFMKHPLRSVARHHLIISTHLSLSAHIFSGPLAPVNRALSEPGGGRLVALALEICGSIHRAFIAMG